MAKSKSDKRLEAKERQEKYDALSLDKKIALTQQRGKSKKELAKLLKKQQNKES